MSEVHDKFSVSGKYVVITGATGGIGLEITRVFLKEEAIVIAVVRRQSAEIKDLQKKYKQLKLHLCDLSDLDEVGLLANSLAEQYPMISVLINNACPNNIPHADEYDLTALEAIRKPGLDAPYILCGKIAPQMANSGTGSIINITSINAEAAWPGNPAYITVKSGLKMLTKAIARDFGEKGIRANNICPGYIHTGMTDKSFQNNEAREARSARTMLGRWGRPEEVANVCLFLASDASSYITGTDICVDGGWLAKGF